MSAAFGVEFSKDDNYLKNAVKSLLGKSENEITEITDKIINEQLRFTIASFSAEDIFRDLKKFQTQIRCDIDQSLGKIELVTNKADFIDITDDAQYCLKEAQKTIEGLPRLEKKSRPDNGKKRFFGNFCRWLIFNSTMYPVSGRLLNKFEELKVID